MQVYLLVYRTQANLVYYTHAHTLRTATLALVQQCLNMIYNNIYASST